MKIFLRLLSNNLPAVFMDLMNRVCKPYLDKFVIVFIDDILIYSCNEDEHVNHLRMILELLKKEKLYAKFSKCDFWIRIVQFLGHLIDNQGLHVDPARIEAVKNWASPTTPTEKNKKYIWGEDQESAFQLLKQKLCKASILALPEGNDIFVVYCDASHQEAQNEALKEENVKAENLRGMDKVFEVRPGGTRYIKNQSCSTLCYHASIKATTFEALYGECNHMAYKLELPEELSNVQNTFYVSNIKKCLSDESLIIPMKELQIDYKLNFIEEPVEIMDREVKQLKQSRIPIVKV
ncbi:putative reverse transcriptase domain-containing protein [Tanacetum coccineum]